MARCSITQNPIDQLRTVTKISTRTFVIVRNTCHIYIYLLVTVIFAVVVCMITFFIRTYLLSPFIIIFWWIWKFCNYVIFRSTSKTFPRRTLCLSVVQITSRTIFFLFLSDPFETFFCRVINILTKSALFLKSVCSFTISSKT